MTTVLVLDDDALTAVEIARVIGEAGYVVIGPFLNNETAMNSISKVVPDVAILDLRIGRRETCEEVAATLTEAGVPLVLISGDPRSTDLLTDSFPDAIFLAKPLDTRSLVLAVARITDAGSRVT